MAVYTAPLAGLPLSHRYGYPICESFTKKHSGQSMTDQMI